MKLAPLLAGLLDLCGAPSARGAVTAGVVGDRLTVRAENASLHDILQAVASAGHFALHLNSPLSDRLSLQIDRRPLRDSLEELLRNQNMLIRYARDGATLRVEEVFVLGPARETARTRDAGADRMAESSPPPASSEQILVALATAPNVAPAERIGAALALGGTDEAARGRDVLADMARSNDDPAVRQQALAALADLSPMPLEELVGAALQDPAPSVRHLALTLVSDLAQADPRAKEVIAQAAAQEQDAELQPMARALLEGARGDQS